MALALYRKYRPGTLAEVIGQDHVTVPLARALANDRIHHAYLFSGPRGCGKTSTARILARSLNCTQGPTPTPCGVCPSCVDLAPNGPGSIDVIELDAATHGLVDDARDLREKAVYAPVVGTYKIYIIDEAHQLGPGAANALLKLVEEPPPHLRFVFATTEPDKIIGTIRSRTHHYPFRLVPVRTLQTHLEAICESEKVPADPAALSLVARAAGGSVRDALSILGQLSSGMDADGLTYAATAAQLGLTDSALMDSVIGAIGAADGAALFRIIDQVIEGGHDARRFATDLLERLRDLLIMTQLPPGEAENLIDGPPELAAELAQQARLFGPGQLTLAAETVSRGISELKGATAPRLQLELLAARLLLPTAASDPAVLLARVERLERDATARPGPEPGPGSRGAQPQTPAGARAVPAAPAAPESGGPAPAAGPAPDARAQQPVPGEVRPPAGAAPGKPRPAQPKQASSRLSAEPPPPLSEVAAVTEPEPVRPAAQPADHAISIDHVRAVWPTFLNEAAAASRVAWTMVTTAQPLSVDNGVVMAAHADPGTVTRFRRSGHEERLSRLLSQAVGAPVTLDLVLAPDAAGPREAVPAREARTTAGASSRGPGNPGSQGADTGGATEQDEDDADAGISALKLVERELGGKLISEEGLG